MGELLSLLCLLHLPLHLGHPVAVSLVLLVVQVAHSRHLLSVIELGGLYYYDSSDLIVNKTFQVKKNKTLRTIHQILIVLFRELH